MRIAPSAVPGTLLGISLTFALPAGAAADEAPVLSLHAFAMNFTGVASGGSGEIDIVIERWSTDQERDQLQAVLAEKGGKGLLPVLQQVKPRVGYIRGGRSRPVSADVQFARSSELPDGGRRVVLATERLRTAAERSRHDPAEEYDFLLIEIRLDRQGKGEGRTADGTRVSLNKTTGTLEIEKYSAQPVKLIHVETLVPKPR